MIQGAWAPQVQPWSPLNLFQYPVGYQVNYLDHCTIMRLICLILCYTAGEIAGIIIVPVLIIAALSVTLIIYIIVKFNCKKDRHQQAIQSLESELR